MRSIFVLFAVVILFTSCGNHKPKAQAGSHMVVVEEVLQAGTQYTYLHVKEGDAESWLAVPSMAAKTGQTLYYKGGLTLKNFESKELKRTFETVIFLNEISEQPLIDTNAGGSEQVASPHSKAPQPEKQDVKVEPAKGGITIAKLYADKKSYDGKIVMIKGQVTKFNAEIMNKNWIHIQDGTEADGKFDLTVTSAIEVKVGDVVTLEGKIALDKDFGMGYAYEVIMEDAVQK